MNDTSFIAICCDLEYLVAKLKQQYLHVRMVDFIKDDFLIDDAKSVIKEAYIAENETKILLLCANKYNTYAQNALLKILEEPPLHVKFILCGSSKSVFLPTIKSRLFVTHYDTQKQNISTNLDFKRLKLKDVYDFISEKKYLPKNELIELVACISKEAIEQGVEFTSEELDIFSKLLFLANYNSKAQNVLTVQLLTILKKGMK